MSGPCWVEKRGSGQEKKQWFLHCDIISVPCQGCERRLQVVRSVICWGVRGRQRDTEIERGDFSAVWGEVPLAPSSLRSLPWLQCLMDVLFYLAPLFTCSILGGAPGLGLSPSSFRHTCWVFLSMPGCVPEIPRALCPAPRSLSTSWVRIPAAHWTSLPSCPLDTSRSACPKLNTPQFSLCP